MCTTAIVLYADDGLSRVSYISFSDQTLMEILISGLPEDAQRVYQDADGMFAAVCEWPGVSCDSNERVAQVRGVRSTSGFLSLSFLPPKLKCFHIFNAGLSGTLETSVLPRCLEGFHAGMNKFDGTLDLTALPEALEKFSVCRNGFTGSADLRRLPTPLAGLWLNSNALTGALCLCSLPPNLRHLNVSANSFDGPFCLQNVPAALLVLRAENNSFSQVAIVPKLTKVFLGNSGVTAIVDVDGVAHAHAATMLAAG